MSNNLSAAEFVARTEARICGARRQVAMAVKQGGAVKLDGKFSFVARSEIASRLLIIEASPTGSCHCAAVK